MSTGRAAQGSRDGLQGGGKAPQGSQGHPVADRAAGEVFIRPVVDAQVGELQFEGLERCR